MPNSALKNNRNVGQEKTFAKTLSEKLKKLFLQCFLSVTVTQKLINSNLNVSRMSTGSILELDR